MQLKKYLYRVEREKGIRTERTSGSLAEAILDWKKTPLYGLLSVRTFPTRFISAKRQEWDDYRLEVTPWESIRTADLLICRFYRCFILSARIART